MHLGLEQEGQGRKGFKSLSFHYFIISVLCWLCSGLWETSYIPILTFQSVSSANQQPWTTLTRQLIVGSLCFCNRLAHFLSEWHKICSGFWVLAIIQNACSLEFKSIPSCFPLSSAADSTRPGVFTELQELILKELCGLNMFLHVSKIRMLSLTSVMEFLTINTWFIVLDLKDAYLYISIHAAHQRYLCFHYSSEIFQYLALPWQQSLGSSQSSWLLSNIWGQQGAQSSPT